MAQGIQVYDNTGNLIIDTSTFVIKAVVSLQVNSAGSVSVTRPANTTLVASAASEGMAYPPKVSVAGNTVSWNSQGSNNFNGRVQIMVY